MSYASKTCDRCGITEEQFYKTHPKRIDYLNYNPLDSMFIGANDEYWCGPCHKELELEKVFKLLDKRKI